MSMPSYVQVRRLVSHKFPLVRSVQLNMGLHHARPTGNQREHYTVGTSGPAILRDWYTNKGALAANRHRFLGGGP